LSNLDDWTGCLRLSAASFQSGIDAAPVRFSPVKQFNQQHNPAQGKRRRAAFLSAEIVMMFPIFMLVLSGLFEFSMLFFARGELAEATRVGARKASLPGVSIEEVEEEVRRVLSPRLQRDMELVIDPGVRSGDVVTVAIAVSMDSASPDLLWPIGYSLKNQQLYEASRMIRE
jgi:hypothetical protein